MPMLILRTKLNSYHPNIKFTFELEKNKQITFLDVLVKKTVTNQIQTCDHTKGTSTDFYINRNSHAPVQWKIGTPGNLVKRANTEKGKRNNSIITPGNRTPKNSIYWNK